MIFTSTGEDGTGSTAGESLDAAPAAALDVPLILLHHSLCELNLDPATHFLYIHEEGADQLLSNPSKLLY